MSAVKYEFPIIAEAVERIPGKVYSHTGACMDLLTSATNDRDIRFFRGPGQVGERCALHLLHDLTTANLQCDFTDAEFPADCIPSRT